MPPPKWLCPLNGLPGRAGWGPGAAGRVKTRGRPSGPHAPGVRAPCRRAPARLPTSRPASPSAVRSGSIAPRSRSARGSPPSPPAPRPAPRQRRGCGPPRTVPRGSPRTGLAIMASISWRISSLWRARTASTRERWSALSSNRSIARSSSAPRSTGRNRSIANPADANRHIAMVSPIELRRHVRFIVASRSAGWGLCPSNRRGEHFRRTGREEPTGRGGYGRQ